MQVIDQLKRKIRGPNLFLMSHTVSIKFPHLENLLIFFCLFICVHHLHAGTSGGQKRAGEQNWKYK